MITAGGTTAEVAWLPPGPSASSKLATLVPIPQPTRIHGKACEIDAINFRAKATTPIDRELLRRAIAKCAAALATATRITMSGYASADGAGVGLDLSERRAQLVARYLVSAGIDPSRLTVRDYGSTGTPPHPPASNPRNRVVIVHDAGHK